MRTLPYIFIILLFGCNNNPKETLMSQKDESLDSLFNRPKKLSDSLINKNSQYYLTHIPLREVAKLILKDSIEPSDNNITFNCLDSLNSKEKEQRDLYYKVTLKIISKSDGALSEAIGIYLISYIEQNTNEFVERLKTTPKKEKDKMSGFVAYELGFTDDKGKKWLTDFQEIAFKMKSPEQENFLNFLTETGIYIEDFVD